MTNLIIISSPLQALNAISAIKHFALYDYEIIIINNAENVFNSILTILNNYNISNHRKINFKSFSDQIKFFFRNKKKHSSKQVQKIFIGDFEDISHLILTTVNMNKETQIYFIDDGNNTILGYANDFRITKIRRYKNFNSIVKYMLADLLVNHRTIINNSSVYSIFHPTNESNFNYIKNDLRFLRDMSASKETIKGVYIIGSPVVESSTISLELYLKIIKDIIAKHQNEPKYYVPHRKEKKEKMSNLIADEEISWIENKTNIELFFIHNEVYPKYIYGFGSSALFTIKELFACAELFNLSFKNEKMKLSSNKEAEYQLIEDYYKSFGIENIGINSINS